MRSGGGHTAAVGGRGVIVDAFSGVGWAWGLRALGLSEVGVELNPDVCALRAGLGLPTIRADVAATPVAHLRGKVAGAIFSPPCQSFSAAGKRRGLDDPRGLLVREPLRWVEAMHPRWVACEQVPEVLPYWRAVAGRLRPLGYSTWTGILDVADYGVPQNRTRAFLMASLDVDVAPPEPTHSRTGHAEMFGAGRERWVSMAEALGWGLRNQPAPSVMTPHGGGLHNALAGGSNATAALKKRMADPDQWAGSPVAGFGRLRHPGRTYGTTTTTTTTTDPAPCVALGHDATSWAWERPATTVMGDPRVFPPGGHHPEAGDPSWSTHAIVVELWELGVLQGFPTDFPWHLAGTKTAQATIIGNAVPPPMAAAVVGALMGAERSVAA